MSDGRFGAARSRYPAWISLAYCQPPCSKSKRDVSADWGSTRVIIRLLRLTSLYLTNVSTATSCGEAFRQTRADKEVRRARRPISFPDVATVHVPITRARYEIVARILLESVGCLSARRSRLGSHQLYGLFVDPRWAGSA